LWGSAHGINVGDGLFVLARLGAHRLTGLGVPPGRQLAVLRALDRACLSLCEGQFLDMSFGERLDVSLEQYLRMIRLKTGALLLAAAEIGAIVAGAEQPVIDHMAAFGENLGVAFQIQDDILGTWGEECVTGKSATTDVRDKKKTLPLTYALAQPEEKGISGPLRALLRQPGTLAANEIEAVIELLGRSGAREYAELSAREHYALAISHLEQAGKSHPARSLLQELGASLLGRVS
jgi:geranylgeranyl diphosphate synthase type I